MLAEKGCDQDAYWRCGEQSTACEKAKEEEARQRASEACGDTYDDTWIKCFHSQDTHYSVEECRNDAKICVVSHPTVTEALIQPRLIHASP